MKIALYVPSRPPGLAANGIVTYASYLVPALRQLGHEVFVLSFARGATDDLYAIDLRQFSTKFDVLDRARVLVAPEAVLIDRMSSAIARAVRELVLKNGIDVVEIEESFGWSYAISRMGLVPVVVRLHGPCFLNAQFDERRNRQKIRREGRGIRHATYVTACSMDTLNAVKIHYGLGLPLSRVVSNPVDARPEGEAWRHDACDANSILFVGRFDEIKGGDLILRAFAKLASSYPRLTLTFIGPDRGVRAAPEDIKICFDQFVRDNVAENIRSRINFRGRLSRDEVMALRTRHFMTVVASRYEAQGYTLMEAMSCGCPTVAAAVGGIPEIVKDRWNGLLVAPQDVNAMVAACRTLLENRPLAAELGHQAWLDCRNLYNSESAARQMLSVYGDAINATKKRQAPQN